MNISNIGHATLHTPAADLYLKNILHVPKVQKNLVSVHKLALDNHVFLEFHPNFFLIKDQVTKRVLHRGRRHGDLYPLVSHPQKEESIKQVYGVNKPSTSRWHSRLGHLLILSLSMFLVLISSLILVIIVMSLFVIRVRWLKVNNFLIRNKIVCLKLLLI